MRGVWVIAFLVNLFLLGSVFDIYFKSPIVHVAHSHRADFPAPTQRLVFFVADGLRADTFYSYPHLRPYLTTVMNRREGVAFGISDTHVPTESRPGHIALFAGFYEDPSAVFTGWKNNLVQFDSVFNQSRGSIALGSPDVVNMFARGVGGSKIYSDTYSSDWQDFLESNSSVLDTWVFERFKELVEHKRLPRHDNLLIFLHLLGIDNTGHATKPHSKEYKQGLTIVDGIVAKVEKMMEKYYGDKDTLFVFTSDHGMTDWGSHGSGSVEETETPILVWGSEIKKTETLRINQADIAALVAGSLGAAFPSNSVGMFPTQIWNDSSFAYGILRANFLQVLELTRTKKYLVAIERNFQLIEFPREAMLMEMFMEAEKLAKEGKQENAISQLNFAFLEVLKANTYYERYNQQLMICFSVAIFLLLMILVTLSILISLEVHDEDLAQLSYVLDQKLFIWALGVATLITKGAIGWSIWKMGYCFVPVYLSLLLIYKFRQKIVVRQKGKLIWSLGLSIIGVQLLVLSFWERSVLSVALFVNLGWVLWSHSYKNRRLKGRELVLYLMAVGVLALFPAVPIIGRARSIVFTTMGPLVSCIMVGFGLVYLGGPAALMNPSDQGVFAIQIFLQATVGLLSHYPTFPGTRLLAWTSLLLAMISPTLTSSKKVVLRLLSIFLALGTPFSYLGISYETLFFPSLFLVLLLFLKLEIDEQSGDEGSPSWQEFFSYSRQESTMIGMRRKGELINILRAFRRAWLHLFFVLLSFFGTGNIGSLSSFDPASTRCFVSVFNPWVMMVLMLSKILAPFLLVSSFWRALLPSRRDVERNFGILLLLCQGMSLTMFFRVRNTGSWLDIGMSISHFVIVQVTTLFLLLFHFIANWLVTYELLNRSNLLRVNSQSGNKHM